MTVREELEMLTGKLIRGNITSTVYDVIKKSPLMNKEEELRKELAKDANSNGAGKASCNLSDGFDDFPAFLKKCQRVRYVPTQPK